MLLLMQATTFFSKIDGITNIIVEHIEKFKGKLKDNVPLNIQKLIDFVNKIVEFVDNLIKPLKPINVMKKILTLAKKIIERLKNWEWLMNNIRKIQIALNKLTVVDDVFKKSVTIDLQDIKIKEFFKSLGLNFVPKGFNLQMPFRFSIHFSFSMDKFIETCMKIIRLEGKFPIQQVNWFNFGLSFDWKVNLNFDLDLKGPDFRKFLNVLGKLSDFLKKFKTPSFDLEKFFKNIMPGQILDLSKIFKELFGKNSTAVGRTPADVLKDFFGRVLNIIDFAMPNITDISDITDFFKEIGPAMKEFAQKSAKKLCKVKGLGQDLKNAVNKIEACYAQKARQTADDIINFADRAQAFKDDIRKLDIRKEFRIDYDQKVRDFCDKFKKLASETLNKIGGYDIVDEVNGFFTEEAEKLITKAGSKLRRIKQPIEDAMVVGKYALDQYKDMRNEVKVLYDMIPETWRSLKIQKCIKGGACISKAFIDQAKGIQEKVEILKNNFKEASGYTAMLNTCRAGLDNITQVIDNVKLLIQQVKEFNLKDDMKKIKDMLRSVTGRNVAEIKEEQKSPSRGKRDVKDVKEKVKRVIDYVRKAKEAKEKLEEILQNAFKALKSVYDDAIFEHIKKIEDVSKKVNMSYNLWKKTKDINAVIQGLDNIIKESSDYAKKLSGITKAFSSPVIKLLTETGELSDVVKPHMTKYINKVKEATDKVNAFFDKVTEFQNKIQLRQKGLDLSQYKKWRLESVGKVKNDLLVIAFSSGTYSEKDVIESVGGDFEDRYFRLKLPILKMTFGITENCLMFKVMGDYIITPRRLFPIGDQLCGALRKRSIENELLESDVYSEELEEVHSRNKRSAGEMPSCMTLIRGNYKRGYQQFMPEWQQVIVVFGIPVKLFAGAGGYWFVDYHGKLCMRDKTFKVGLIPGAWIGVYAGASITIFIVEAGITIEAILLETYLLPELTVKIDKWPLKACIELKLRLTPLKIRVWLWYRFRLCIRIRCKCFSCSIKIRWCSKKTFAEWWWSARQIERTLFSTCKEDVDTTPPIAGTCTAKQVGDKSYFVQWHGFKEDTRINHYWVKIGSIKGSGDDYGANVGTSLSAFVKNIPIMDGRDVYASVRATNDGGLDSRLALCAIFKAKRIGPQIRYVNDGSDIGLDRDFQSDDYGMGVNFAWSTSNQKIVDVKWGISSISKCAFDESEVDVYGLAPVGETTSIQTSGISLKHGAKYYARIIATNSVGLRTIMCSDGIVIDTTPPIAGYLFDGSGNEDVDFIPSTKRVRAKYEAFTDSESPMVKYEWKVIYYDNLKQIDITPFVDIPLSQRTPLMENLNLRLGQRYNIILRAPLAGSVVYDGHKDGADIDFQLSNCDVSAHWNSLEDPESDIVKVTYCVGTTPGFCDLLPRQTLSPWLHKIHEVLNEPMRNGQRFYVTVQATNGAGETTTVTSDGVTVDNTPPTPGRVFDGNTSKDIDFLFGDDDVVVNWLGFKDDESGIKNYEVAICDARNLTNCPQQFTDVNNVTSIKITGLDLESGTMYVAKVKSTNYAGLQTEVSSNGFTVDFSPPIKNVAWVGAGNNSVIIYSTVDYSIVMKIDLKNYKDILEPSLRLTKDNVLVLVSKSKGNVVVAQLDIASKSSKTVCSYQVPSDVRLSGSLDLLDRDGGTVVALGMQTMQGRDGVILTGYHGSFAYHPFHEEGKCIGLGRIIAREDIPRVDDGTPRASVSAEGSTILFGTPGVLTWPDGGENHGTGRVYSMTYCPRNYKRIKASNIEDQEAFQCEACENGRMSLGGITRICAVCEDRKCASPNDIDPVHFVTNICNQTQCPLMKQFNNKTNAITIEQMNGTFFAEGAVNEYTVKLVEITRSGMSTTSKSEPFIIDTTSPDVGTVYDGLGSNPETNCSSNETFGEDSQCSTRNFQDTDIDYTNNTSEVHARWIDFADNESDIAEYFWCIGSKPMLDDIRQCESNGLRQNASEYGFNFKQGDTYYVTVVACNGAQRCSAGHSNGVTIDTTPPVMQYVRDGVLGPDIDYQVFLDIIFAYFKASDPDSGVTSYEVAWGTAPGKVDTKDFEEIGNTTTWFAQFNDDGLKKNTKYYATQFMLGNYSFQIKAFDPTNNTIQEGYKFAKPIKISMFYDVDNLVNANKRVVNKDVKKDDIDPVLYLWDLKNKT
ncbi:hypothetical protein QZH41_001674 [Actinostola sp. cb2023]|nr:hypothetical protein QZH41_001674 [Actinostola sp. cb2023]